MPDKKYRSFLKFISTIISAFKIERYLTSGLGHAFANKRLWQLKSTGQRLRPLSQPDQRLDELSPVAPSKTGRNATHIYIPDGY